jgi:F0F1-type ATP synthase membrane subunit b/b'
MINTPEFWVGVSFCICIGISYTLIFPTVKAGLVSHQGEIERLFSDAEAVLQSAEKKFSLAQERLNELPNLIAEMETEFDARVSHLLHDWTIQREKIMVRYRSLQDHKLQHSEDHAKSQSYAYVSDVCIHALQAYASQHMNSKKHQQLVIDALKNLPNV